MLYNFDKFVNTKILQKKEESPIVDELEAGGEEKIEGADEIEPVERLKKKENKNQDYYDAKQDFIAPKPFRKK